MNVQREVATSRCRHTDMCKVVNIKDFQTNKKEKIEEWLEKEMSERYGHEDKEFVLGNPLLRIITKFEMLDHDSQIELYGYAKSVIIGFGNEVSLRDKLWGILEKGSSGNSWEIVEEFATALLLGNNMHNCN